MSSLLDKVDWHRLDAPLPPGVTASRAGHATAVLGDHVYLHGGRIEYVEQRFMDERRSL